MIKNILQKKSGFTLVEVLIAMAIFMMFSGILINSYGSIVKSQRDANEYRVMYSEAGVVFDTMVGELRDGMVDYVHYATGLPQISDQIYLVRKDGMGKTHINFKPQDEEIEMEKGELDSSALLGSEPAYSPKIVLNNNVKVKSLKFYISPVIDPYDVANVHYDLNQFHPKVTIFAEFEKVVDGKTYSLPLQTTISSRIYNQIYKPQY